jgi:hypothetical protein
MPFFRIHNPAAGLDLGVYPGATGDDAILACITAAGYDSIADMGDDIAPDGTELEAVPAEWVYYRDDAAPQDSDHGRIMEVHADGMLTVAWEGGMAQTTTYPGDIQFAADRQAARAGAFD